MADVSEILHRAAAAPGTGPLRPDEFRRVAERRRRRRTAVRGLAVAAVAAIALVGGTGLRDALLPADPPASGSQTGTGAVPAPGPRIDIATAAVGDVVASPDGDGLVAVAGSELLWSPDGVTWHRAVQLPGDADVRWGLARRDDEVLAYVELCGGAISGCGTGTFAYRSADGRTWATAAPVVALAETLPRTSFLTLVGDGDGYLALLGRGANGSDATLWRSTDLQAWEPGPTLPVDDQPIVATGPDASLVVPWDMAAAYVGGPGLDGVEQVPGVDPRAALPGGPTGRSVSSLLGVTWAADRWFAAASVTGGADLLTAAPDGTGWVDLGPVTELFPGAPDGKVYGVHVVAVDDRLLAVVSGEGNLGAGTWVYASTDGGASWRPAG